MEIIENKTDTGIVVSLDDKHFVNCIYKNCTVIYGGGEYALTNTKFENCQISLQGAAQRTAGLLQNFGALKPMPPQVPPAPGIN